MTTATDKAPETTEEPKVCAPVAVPATAVDDSDSDSDSDSDVSVDSSSSSSGGETESKECRDYWAGRPVFVGIVEHHDDGLHIKDVFARTERGTVARLRTLPLRLVAPAGAPGAGAVPPPPPGTVLRVRVVRNSSSGDGPSVLAEADLADAACHLAQPGSALAASYGLACGHGLDPVFPPAVEAEVAGFLARPGLDDARLRDLTGLAFVTIDGDDSRDLDQAMYICRGTGACRWVVYYALADASYYVRPGSALWREALRRGASYYFPGLAVPMLPRAFSEGLVSLNEGVVRRALVFEMAAGARGELLATRVYRARIRSRRKLSYRGVQAFHDAGRAGALAGHDYTETLVLLRELGEARIADAAARNVVRFVRAELCVSAGAGPGASFSLVADERLDCEKWNEQVSLMCNIAGAHLLIDAGATLHGIWRVHGAPPPERLAALARLADSLARTHGDPEPAASVWHWRREGAAPESLADYLARIQAFAADGLANEDPRVRRTEVLARARICRAIQRAAMMTNQAAEIETYPGPHFGVGADCYARFSSPMRQIEGIFLHRELIRVIEGQQGQQEQQEQKEQDNSDQSNTADDDADAEALRASVVGQSRCARRLQGQITKEGNRLAIDAVFSSDLAWPLPARPVHRGTVLGIGTDNNRVYVELDNPPVEVKVYLNPLCKHTGKSFRINKRATVVVVGTARVRVGDAIGLRVVRGAAADEPWLLEPLIDRTAPATLAPTSTPLLAAAEGTTVEVQRARQQQRRRERKNKNRGTNNATSGAKESDANAAAATGDPSEPEKAQQHEKEEKEQEQHETHPALPPARPVAEFLRATLRPHWLHNRLLRAFTLANEEHSQQESQE